VILLPTVAYINTTRFDWQEENRKEGVTFSWIRGFLYGIAGNVYGTLLYCCGQTIDFSSFEFKCKCREMPFGIELVEDKRLFNKLWGLTGYQSRSWIPLGFGGDVTRGSETLTGD